MNLFALRLCVSRVWFNLQRERATAHIDTHFLAIAYDREERGHQFREKGTSNSSKSTFSQNKEDHLYSTNSSPAFRSFAGKAETFCVVLSLRPVLPVERS